MVLGQRSEQNASIDATTCHHMDLTNAYRQVLGLKDCSVQRNPKYGIDLADRTDLVPSILTAKHLDFL